MPWHNISLRRHAERELVSHRGGEAARSVGTGFTRHKKRETFRSPFLVEELLRKFK